MDYRVAQKQTHFEGSYKIKYKQIVPKFDIKCQ